MLQAKSANNIFLMMILSLVFSLTACGGGSGSGKSADEKKGFSAADFNKQVFVSFAEGNYPESTTLFYEGGIGVHYVKERGVAAEKSVPPINFTWEIKDKKLEAAINGGTGSFSYALKKVDGNKYTVVETESSKASREHVINKAKALSVASLNKKILVFDTVDTRKCTKPTIRVAGNQGWQREICPVPNSTNNEKKNIEVKMMLSDVSGLDHMIQFKYEGDPKPVWMVLLEGDLSKKSTVEMVYKEANGHLIGLEEVSVSKSEKEAY
jgi:hypothetical protein